MMEVGIKLWVWVASCQEARAGRPLFNLTETTEGWSHDCLFIIHRGKVIRAGSVESKHSKGSSYL